MKCFTLIYIFLLALCVKNTVFSQVKKEKSLFSKFISQHDTLYVEKTEKDFSFILNSKNWMDVYQLKIGDEFLSLRSDLSYNVGGAFGYKILQLGYSFNINNLMPSKKKIKRNEWNLKLANNMFSFEIYHFSNQGQTNILEYKKDTFSLSVNKAFNRLNTRIFGTDLYYFFNHKKYINAYANRLNYKQRKSSGSFILGLSFSYESLFFDFSQLPEVDELKGLISSDNQKNTYTTYCISIGYGYNFVFFKNWLLNISLIPSIGASVDSNKNKEPGYLSVKNKVRFALIQDLDKFLWGLKCKYNTHWYYTDNNSITNSIGNFNLLIGIRF